MFGRKPVEIKNVDEIKIQIDSHPGFLGYRFERLVEELVERSRRHDGFTDTHSTGSEGFKNPPWVKYLNIAATAISALSGLSILVLVILMIQGTTSLGTVTISSLLTIFSTSLIGSLLSIGGVTLFSLSANLKKTKSEIGHIPQICPYESIQLKSGEANRPGNPEFCVKCPLGIDLTSNIEGFLMHNCKVYLVKHNEWRSTPEARPVLKRRHWV